MVTQIVLWKWLAAALALIAHRRTDIPAATKGHKHWFFSFYLTEQLNLRRSSGKVIEAASSNRMVLWIVFPRVFHEWVTEKREESGVVHDLTPLHQAHTLAS